MYFINVLYNTKKMDLHSKISLLRKSMAKTNSEESFNIDDIFHNAKKRFPYLRNVT